MEMTKIKSIKASVLNEVTKVCRYVQCFVSVKLETKAVDKWIVSAENLKL